MSEVIHVDSSDWSTTRGWVPVPVSTSELPELVRRAVATSDRFSVFEVDEDGAILVSRSTFTSRALRTRLEFETDSAGGSRVVATCRSTNIVGLMPGLQYCIDAVKRLLESIDSAADGASPP